MKSKIEVFVCFIALLMMVVQSPGIHGGNTISSYKMTNIAPEQSESIWYNENIWTEFSPDGYMYGDASLSGNGLLYDDLDPSALIPDEFFSIFRWGDMWTAQPDDVEMRNLWLSFTFQTNDPSIAENAARSVINSLGSRILIEQLEFRGSEGFDDNFGDGWKSYTNVWFEGRVEWVNMQELINRSIPRNYGGLAATIDIYPAEALNFHFWLEGESSVAASIGLHYNKPFIQQMGGFNVQLSNLIPVQWFAPSDYSDKLYIHHRLPDVSNLAYSLTNTSDTNVYIKYDPSEEMHNQHAAYLIDTVMDSPANYSDITFNFDFTFNQHSWMNNEFMDWNVDERGYSEVSLGIDGKDRVAPNINLFPNATLFDDVVLLWLDVDRQYLDVPFHDTQWLNIKFPVGFDFTSANATAFAIKDELETMGIQFTNNWTDGTWGEETDNKIHWLSYNNSYVMLDGISFSGRMSDSSIFENFVTNSYVYPRSAALQASNLANFQSLSWHVFPDRWGKAAHFSIRVDSLHRALTTPLTPFIQLTDTTLYVDLFDPLFINWGGTIPWNAYSEQLQVNFRSPYTGDFSEIDFQPIDNNGWGWDSYRHRWMEGQTDRLEYGINIFNSNPQMQDEIDGEWVNTGPFTGANLTFTTYYYDNSYDLEEPFISGAYYKNLSQIGSHLSEYNQYFYLDSDQVISGELDLAFQIRDDWGRDYWDGSQWLQRFPSSGIKNVTAYMFRSDAPVDHPSFTKGVSLIQNSTWVDHSISNQVWDASIDTSQYPDGEWQIWGDTYDMENNFGSSSFGNIIFENYDGSPATITWDDSAPANDSAVEDIVWFNFTIEDDNGIFAVVAYNNLGGYVLEPETSTSSAFGITQTYAFKVDTLAQLIPENSPMTITIEVLDMDGIWTYSSIKVIIDNLKTGNAPTISLLNPSDGITIDNTETSELTFTANIVDDWGIKSAVLNIEGTSTKEFNLFIDENSGEYTYTASIENWPLGDYSWSVTVIDVDENTHTITSEMRGFEIIGISPIGDDIPPQISLLRPTDGSTVSGEVDIAAEVTDNIAISQVSITLPDREVVEMEHSNGDEYEYSWDSKSVIDQEVTLIITAKDTSGNTATYEFTLITNNGRVRSDPEIGLPGFGFYLTIISIILVLIIKRKKY